MGLMTLLTASAAGGVHRRSPREMRPSVPWGTAAHVPAFTLPVFTGPQGLPVGAQVIGKRHEHRAPSCDRPAGGQHLTS